MLPEGLQGRWRRGRRRAESRDGESEGEGTAGADEALRYGSRYPRPHEGVPLGGHTDGLRLQGAAQHGERWHTTERADAQRRGEAGERPAEGFGD